MSDITRGAGFVIEDFDGNPIRHADGKQPSSDGTSGVHSGSDHGGGETVIDPASLQRSGVGSSGSEPKRRGRQPGSKNKSKEEASSNISSIIASSLFGFHKLMFMASGAPEWPITKEEAKELGDAFDAVAAQYKKLRISKKTEAWINLGTAISGVYAGRVTHYYFRTMGSKQPHPQAVR